MRALHRLSDRLVRSAGPGLFSDGGNLYLLVKKTGTKSWVFRYRSRTTGKLRDKGLGPLTSVSLKQARERAAQFRLLLVDGGDPIDATRQARADTAQAAARAVTFGHCAEQFIESHRAGWRNAKHAQQWTNTLATLAAKLKSLPVASIDTGLVMQVVEPLWTERTETATRVRQRIESILDWATARKYRDGDNPARLRGHLDKLLPQARKVSTVRHMPAMPYAELPAFIKALRPRGGAAARALELIILTAARASEAVGATWGELDLAESLWTIPGDRMKAGRPHRVPLSSAAIELLQKHQPDVVKPTDFVFPGARTGRSMTIAAPLRELQRDMKRPDCTTHGFRSSFRDWAAERTTHAREVIEACLAHANTDKTEAAYLRSDVLAKRARLMADWTTFLEIKAAASADVTPIQQDAAE